MELLRAYSTHIVPQRFSAGLLTAAILAAGTAALRPAFADTYTNAVIDRTAGGQAVGSATSDTDGYNHALLWLSNGTLVDLNPAGFRNSLANGTNGSQQVGSAYTTATSSSHAVIWSGSPTSITDLNPATGYEIGTFAYGISPDGSQQVGYGYGSATSYNANALLWTGSAASVVNLQPTNLTGFTNSFAYGTDGTYQVGYGNGTATGGSSHALLWSGTANSAVDLHPATGFTDSFAEGVGGGQQVGYGYTSETFSIHALLWTGTAASAVDLNPAGYNDSSAYSTNGIKQVGYGNDSSFTARALVWTGTAASAIDLSAFLPTGTWTFSIAYDINADGDIFGWANGTYNGVQDLYAIEWTPELTPAADLFSPDAAVGPSYTGAVLYEAAVPIASPVPEPASLSLLALATLPLLLRRRRSSPSIRH